MKKIFFAFTFLVALSFLGTAQKSGRVLEANKWYMVGGFAPQNITLGKNTSTTSDANVVFNSNGTMNYCSLVRTSFKKADGSETLAGTYHCDALYTFELKDGLVHVKYPLFNYYYKVSKLANGDLELIYTSHTEAVNGSTTK